MEDLRKSYYHKQDDYYGNKNENIASSLSYLSVFLRRLYYLLLCGL